MINIKADKGAVELHTEGSTLILTVEAVGSSVALVSAIAKIRNVSFENAALYLMQESIKFHNMKHEEIEHEY